jgi:hypothetical protein
VTLSIHRRSLGRGRWVAGIAAVALLVGCILPWYTAGGGTGIPAISGNAFEGPGIVCFLVSLATLALIALPYAAGDSPVSVDRWQSYALLAVVGLVAFAIRVVQLVTSASGPAAMTPDKAPGLWISGVALIALAWAAFDIFTARHADR